MNKLELKKIFFEKGAKAFQKITKFEHPCYCCPICRNIFPFEAIDTGMLTLEHVPPAKLGGKPIALTCKKCNSIAGYSIDAAIVNREKLGKSIDALVNKKGNFEGRATLEIGGETINVILDVNEGIVKIKPPKEINDPSKISFLKDYMMQLSKDGKGDGEEFKLTPKITYRAKYSKVGDLKTAFLVCFAFFGYSYVLNKRLSDVQKQIVEFNDSITDWYWIKSDEEIEEKYGLLLLTKPVPAIAVIIDKVTILLPWFESPQDLYGYFEKNYSNGKMISFKGDNLRWPQSLEMNLDFFKRT